MHIEHIHRDHILRHDLEQATQGVYQRSYQAFIPEFPDHLVAVMGEDGTILGSVGLRRDEDMFFCEHYFSQPIEAELSNAFKSVAQRQSIVEVTNLAGVRPGYVFELLYEVIQFSLNLNMEFAVFTATQRLRKLLTRMGLPFQVLGVATEEDVPLSQSWGQYYEAKPYVCAVSRQELCDTGYIARFTIVKEKVPAYV